MQGEQLIKIFSLKKNELFSPWKGRPGASYFRLIPLGDVSFMDKYKVMISRIHRHLIKNNYHESFRFWTKTEFDKTT